MLLPKRSRRAGAQADAPRRTRIRNPASGLSIAPDLSIYHDATGGEFACVRGGDVQARFVIYQFHGSYLSVAAALADKHRRRVGPGRKLAVRLDVEVTRPLTVFLRVNLQSDKSSEKLFETIVVDRGARDVSFDLDAARIPLHDIDAIWMDIIFSEPEMCEITIQQLDLEVVDDAR